MNFSIAYLLYNEIIETSTEDLLNNKAIHWEETIKIEDSGTVLTFYRFISIIIRSSIIGY